MVLSEVLSLCKEGRTFIVQLWISKYRRTPTHRAHDEFLSKINKSGVLLWCHEQIKRFGFYVYHSGARKGPFWKVLLCLATGILEPVATFATHAKRNKHHSYLLFVSLLFLGKCCLKIYQQPETSTTLQIQDQLHENYITDRFSSTQQRPTPATK